MENHDCILSHYDLVLVERPKVATCLSGESRVVLLDECLGLTIDLSFSICFSLTLDLYHHMTWIVRGPFI